MDERFNQDCGDCIDKECKNTGMVGRIPDTDKCCVVNDEPQNTKAKPSHTNDWLCADCGENAPVPFDCGDGKIRCAGCAVDVYMKDISPRTTIVIRPHVVARKTSI